MAEGGGLLNRYTMSSRIVSSNLIPSAIFPDRLNAGDAPGVRLARHLLPRRQPGDDAARLCLGAGLGRLASGDQRNGCVAG